MFEGKLILKKPDRRRRHPHWLVTIIYRDKQEFSRVYIDIEKAKKFANKEISVVLGITVRTVETHRAKIMFKLDLHSIAELIHYALGKWLTGSPLSAR